MILRWSVKPSRHQFTWKGQNKQTLASVQDRGDEAVAAVVGARGERGETGDQGPQGIQGPAGNLTK